MRPWAGSWRWITLVLLAWGTLLFYIGGHLVRDSEHPERSSRELSKILAKLERLKQQNEDLRRMAESLRIPEGQAEAGSLAVGRLRSLEDQLTRAKQKIHSFQKLTGDGPGPTQEELRRRVENGVKEFWYFVRSEVKKLASVEAGERQKYADTLLQDLGHQERSIMTDLYYLSQADGVGEWRVKEAKDLSDLVQNRITYLQVTTHAPADEPAGLVFRLAHTYIATCWHSWLYVYRGLAPHWGPSFVFSPACPSVQGLCQAGHSARGDRIQTTISPTSALPTPTPPVFHSVLALFCVAIVGEAHDKDVQVVELPIVDSLHPRPPYLPLAIPEDLAPRLQRLHGDPSVWWVSQFVKYLVRPQGWLEKEIQQTTAKLGFKHPIIGVHVRRTDKVGTEAAFHPIEEYMLHVEEQFQHLARRVHIDKKRVYLATDDPSLLQEAKTKYPDYEFISDNSISWSAGLHNRYTENSLRGVILDIHFLSQTDFLVCTFSSQVCRVAYEIMQTLHPDASSFFYSLDDIYYFGGQNAHNQIAVYPHQPRNNEDIPLEPGDVIGVAGNHWDGYSKGINRKLGRTGLYPSYKVKEKIETVKYPMYPEADKLLNSQKK
ncbi:alpha-(1,6)-fucosyltransferase [Solea solea]|uniref:alpha-(1,6)-fucosyltransferase n=1 Tax=Solea solea TaxID=90069 RepID=UPI002729B71D|nr:alpha-(1,6)-fucosyltransferase [Solea solea]